MPKTQTFSPEAVTDCFVTPGSSDNGNLLWVYLGSELVIVGGYSTLGEAQEVARGFGWDARIEED